MSTKDVSVRFLLQVKDEVAFFFLQWFLTSILMQPAHNINCRPLCAPLANQIKANRVTIVINAFALKVDKTASTICHLGGTSLPSAPPPLGCFVGCILHPSSAQPCNRWVCVFCPFLCPCHHHVHILHPCSFHHQVLRACVLHPCLHIHPG